MTARQVAGTALHLIGMALFVIACALFMLAAIVMAEAVSLVVRVFNFPMWLVKRWCGPARGRRMVNKEPK